MRKNVLVLAPLPPPIGGISQLGAFIARSIDGVCIHDTKVPDILRKSPYANSKSILSRDGYFLVFVQLIYLTIDFVKFTIKLLNYRCVHIISSTGPGLYRNIVFSLLSYIFRRRQVFHLVGDIENHTKNLSIIHKKFIFHYFRFIGNVVVQSDKHRLFLLEKGIHSTVIRNPSLLNSSTKNRYKFNNENFLILTVGIFGERKGFYRILDYISNNRKIISDRNIRFEFVGNGEEYEALKSNIEKRDLSDVINVRHNVSVAELFHIYKLASLFLLPTSSDGMPLVIIDAMSFGVPVISSDVGCISDVIVDEYLLIKNISNWDKCLEYFLSLNDDEIRSLSDKTYSLYRLEYSQKVFLDKIRREYGV